MKADKNINTDLTEMSPFSGKTSVVVETGTDGIETRLCMDTGFTTTSEYKIGSWNVQEYEKTTTKLIIDLRYDDLSLGQHWYPTTVIFSTGIIYPEGTPEKWEWVYAPVITMDDEEKKNYPVPEKPGEFYETRVAVDVAERYKNNDFRTVCKRVGIAKDI